MKPNLSQSQQKVNKTTCQLFPEYKILLGIFPFYSFSCHWCEKRNRLSLLQKGYIKDKRLKDAFKDTGKNFQNEFKYPQVSSAKTWIFKKDEKCWYITLEHKKNNLQGC